MMQWPEIVQLSKQTGVHRNTIKHRVDRGLSGEDLVKPPKAGNYQITEQKALAIWKDLQHYIATYQPKTIDITGVVAKHHGVSRTLVQNIRHGGSWNSVTGLPKRQREESPG